MCGEHDRGSAVTPGDVSLAPYVGMGGGHSAAAASEPCYIHLHAVVEGKDGGGTRGGRALL